MQYISDPMARLGDWDKYQFNFWSASPLKRVAYIHVPRTGGTSMEQALRTHVPGCRRGMEVDLYDQSIFTFAFVRNPWDRLVSSFFQMRQNDPNEFKKGFIDWVYQNVLDVDLMEKWKTSKPATVDHWFPYEYHLGPYEKPYANFIGRFEHIKRAWPEICRRIGIEMPLGHSDKTRSRGKRPEYQVYYTPELMNKIGDVYKRDVEHFNYEF